MSNSEDYCCPICWRGGTKVIRTTKHPEYILRRRECPSCHSRWTTKERVLGLAIGEGATYDGQSEKGME